MNLHPEAGSTPQGRLPVAAHAAAPAAGEGSGGMRPGEAAEGTESRRRQEGRTELQVQGRGGPGAEDSASRAAAISRRGWEGPAGRRGGPGLGKNCREDPGARLDTVSTERGTWRAWGGPLRDGGARAHQPEGPGLVLCPGDAQSRPRPCPLLIVHVPAPPLVPSPDPPAPHRLLP